MDAVFDNEGFAMLLDHTSLYYYVLNQTERATVYRQLMNNHLSKQKSKKMYKPKFHLPRTMKEKEQICQLIEPSKSRSDSKISSEEREIMAVESKLEGDIYIKQKNYIAAVIAYNTALDMTTLCF